MLKRKAFLLYIAALFIICSSYTPAYSYYFDSIDKVKFQGYRGEGNFVENPAYCGDCFGYVILGIPLAALISEPQRIANYNDASDDVGVAVLKCCTKPFGLFFGAFPWALKKAFWDFPIWIGGGDVSKPSSYEYKPIPVPEPEVPPQLLEEPKVKLNESLATPAQPKLTEIVEPKHTGDKIELKPISTHMQADTQKVPQLQQIPGTQNIQAPKVDVPAAQTEDRIDDQTPKSSSQSWETPQIPEWLNKDLTQ